MHAPAARCMHRAGQRRMRRWLHLISGACSGEPAVMRHVTTRVSGLIILIAGIWGGPIPFVGPYFHFTLGPR
jgi:hypothetical protein